MIIPLLISCLVTLCLFCVGMLFNIASEEKREKQARLADAEAEIQAAGFSSDGDPFGHVQLRTSMDGMELFLDSRCERTLPGKASMRETVCLVTMNVEGPALLICRKIDSGEILGPSPSALRFPLCEPAFAEVYEAYTGDSIVEDGELGYRGAPERPLFSWARPEILERLQDFSLLWLQVRDGKGEVAFRPVRYKRALAILRLVRVIALGAQNIDSGGLPAVDDEAAPLPEETARPRLVDLSLFLSLPFLIGLFLGSFGPIPYATRHTVCPSGVEDTPSRLANCVSLRSDAIFMWSTALSVALSVTVATVIFSLPVLVRWYRRKAGR